MIPTISTGKTVPDFVIQGHGSISLVWPRTKQARLWAEDNLDIRQMWGAAIIVEHQYISIIIAAIIDAGYTIA